MVDLGAAVLALGTQVVKRACHLWIGDGFAQDAADSIADLLKDQVSDALQRQRLKSMFEGFAVTVAEKAKSADDAKSRSLPDNEREAAIHSVAETFEETRLDDAQLLAVNLDARALEQHLRKYVDTRTRAWGLSDAATNYFDFLLRECCSYLLEIKKALPPFTAEALTELLRRSSAIERQLAELLDRIPERTGMTGDEGFETDYRRQVATELDAMDLVGASVFERNRGYRLSVAYISLLVAESNAPRGVPVEQVLSGAKRLFFRGEAGSGKTTLLQWLAISAARRAFPEHLGEWNDLVPFFIRLRQFAEGVSLPQPEDFLRAGTAKSLAGVMPTGWVHRILQAGRAVVLVDGVDELPRTDRGLILDWLRGLTAAFPHSRFLITSRPAATNEDWLAMQDFYTYSVQPMSLPDIRGFIEHWHDAVKLQLVDQAAKDELTTLCSTLTDQIFTKRHLRLLATNPLMCALLCALNRDRRAELPESRIELFHIALEMFLQRRDSERRMAKPVVHIEYTDKLDLLCGLAYWMMTNNLPEAERSRVYQQVQTGLLARRHRVPNTTEEVLEHLLERSGVVREPVPGQIDFIHRSFQEFLAAQAIVDRDDIEALQRHAADDQWRQVLVLAAGLANRRQSEQLLTFLLSPPVDLLEHSKLFDLLALGCLETIRDVEPAAARLILARTGALLPPRSDEHVETLARAGDYVFELIADVSLNEAVEFEYAAKLAARVGGPAGLQLMEKIHREPSAAELPMVRELVTRSWDMFEPIDYAQRIIALLPRVTVRSSNPKTVPGLLQATNIDSLSCDFGRDYSDFTFLGKMPWLNHVSLRLDFGHRPVALSIGSNELSVTMEARASRPPRFLSALPYLPHPLLMITQLSATGLLAGGSVSTGFRTLIIDRDPMLADLSGLRLPKQVQALVLAKCPVLSTLHGVHQWIGHEVRELILVDPADTLISLGALVEHGLEGCFLDQLESVSIYSSNLTGDRYAQLYHLMMAVQGHGFSIDNEQMQTYTVLNATRFRSTS